MRAEIAVPRRNARPTTKSMLTIPFALVPLALVVQPPVHVVGAAHAMTQDVMHQHRLLATEDSHSLLFPSTLNIAGKEVPSKQHKSPVAGTTC